MKTNKFWNDKEIKLSKEELTEDQKEAIKYTMKIFIEIHAGKARSYLETKNGK
jgi:hypothetical protein